MRISTKGRYGVRLMVELGLNYHRNTVPLKEIAVNQNISEKYLEQIINQLNKARLVKSMRGIYGGYRLARPPNEIKLSQILDVLEGSLAPVACVEDNGEMCRRAKTCPCIDLWKEIDDAVSGIIDKYSLSDIIEIQKKKWGKLSAD